jgi:hypothetical protein
MGSAAVEGIASKEDLLLDSLLVEEYRSLRCQLDYQVKETRDLERYALVGIGLVFAWLASIERPTPLVLPAWLFPPLLAIMGWVRAKSIMRRIDQAASYIRKIEEHVYGVRGELVGWETTMAKSRKANSSPGLAASQRLLWRAAILFSLAGSVYGFVCQNLHFWH